MKVLLQLLSKVSHNIFCRDEIRADQKRGTEIGVGIHY